MGLLLNADGSGIGGRNGRREGGRRGGREGGSWPLPLSPVECLNSIGGGRTKTICPEEWQHLLMVSRDGNAGDGDDGDGGGGAGRGGDD